MTSVAPGASPTHGAGAPRTALAGPHAAATAALIERMGPRCEAPPQASHSAPPLPARWGGLARAVIPRATCSWLGACAAARPRTGCLRRSRRPPAPRHAWRHPEPWATVWCRCVVPLCGIVAAAVCAGRCCPASMTWRPSCSSRCSGAPCSGSSARPAAAQSARRTRSPCLPMSPHISPHLPTSPHISQGARAPRRRARCSRARAHPG